MNNRRSNKDSVLAITLLFLLLFFFFHHLAFVYLSAALILVSLASGTISKWIDLGWRFLADGAGRISGTIILSVLFVVFVLPIALILRMFKKDIMNLKVPKSDSIFEKTEKKYSPVDLQHPY